MKLTPKSVLAILFIVFFAGCLVGCNPERKIQKAEAIIRANPDKAAELCADMFPVIPRVEYLPGKTVYDTLYEYRDNYIEVTCPPADRDTIIRWRTITPSQSIVVKRTDTVKVTVPDSSKEAVLHGRIRTISMERDSYKVASSGWQKKYKVSRQNNWILWLIIGALVAWTFRGVIFPAAGKLIKLIAKLF